MPIILVTQISLWFLKSDIPEQPYIKSANCNLISRLFMNITQLPVVEFSLERMEM